MEKITEEIRNRLRAPLAVGAVSPHPTKTYLSSIKSIYVAERINDVFGVGSWTLKSEVVERLDYQKEDRNKEAKEVRFVVVKATLEIPEYGFYGEAYGGNDNEDIGDAYKGATTDAFTKIAGQQLEIGIDVFKGLQTRKEKPEKPITPARKPDKPTPKQYGRLAVALKKYDVQEAKTILIERWQTNETKNLNSEQMEDFIAQLEKGKEGELAPEDIPF